MNDYTKEIIPRLPPPPPQLVQLIETSRQARIAAVRQQLDELLKMDPLTYVYEHVIEVFGDVAETICGERVCKITGDSAGRWLVSFHGGRGEGWERKVDVEIIYAAFDPERANDAKRLNASGSNPTEGT